MLAGWLGHCLTETGSSRVGHVFRAGRWELLSSLEFDGLELFAFFLRLKRLHSRDDLLINQCWLLEHGEWSPCSASTVPGGYYCSLLHWFDWHVVTAHYFTFVSLLWYLCRGHEFFLPPALASCTIEATELLSLAINPSVLSWVTAFLFKKAYAPKHWPFWRPSDSQQLGVVTAAFWVEVFPSRAFHLVLMPFFAGQQVSGNLEYEIQFHCEQNGDSKKEWRISPPLSCYPSTNRIPEFVECNLVH